MKCTVPEISWHNRDPVLSIDIQVKQENESYYRLASGGTDAHVLIWHLYITSEGGLKLDCAAELTRHHKAVNVVRFSPCGNILASGDDESVIILWKKKEIKDDDIFEENEASNKERWVQDKILRGHMNDVYDISWCPDSSRLISGSVDNTAIVWDVAKGKRIFIIDDHNNFVQGVSWDPKNEYVATMCSDSTCRVFSTKNFKAVSRMSKGRWFSQQDDSKPMRLFHDDTLKTFFRRLSFSPDGSMIVVPSGIYDHPEAQSKRVTWVFPRIQLNKPVLYFPTYNQSSTVIKFCPVRYTLRENETPVFNLPYRMVIAVATKSTIILFDTQHAVPIGLISNIHYAKITDLSWSSDGKMLVASSTDGYCSFIVFPDDELGTPYIPPTPRTPPIVEASLSSGPATPFHNGIKSSTNGGETPNSTKTLRSHKRTNQKSLSSAGKSSATKRSPNQGKSIRDMFASSQKSKSKLRKEDKVKVDDSKSGKSIVDANLPIETIVLDESSGDENISLLDEVQSATETVESNQPKSDSVLSSAHKKEKKKEIVLKKSCICKRTFPKISIVSSELAVVEDNIDMNVVSTEPDSKTDS